MKARSSKSADNYSSSNLPAPPCLDSTLTGDEPTHWAEGQEKIIKRL